MTYGGGHDTALVRFRWIISNPGQPRFRRVEEIISRAACTIRASLSTHPGLDSFYVSKHDGCALWLTVFCHPAQLAGLRTVVEPALQPFTYRTDGPAERSEEALLAVECSPFRACVHLATEIALDLHCSGDLPARQKELIAVGCRARISRADLEPILEAHSATYRSLEDREDFWGSLVSNCLNGQSTDCGHWIYNIVLGVDWFEGHRIGDVEDALGL